MKKVMLLLLLVVLVLSTAACSSFPAKKDTLMAPYSKILVKPLSFDEVALSKLVGSEPEEFYKAKPALTKVFNDNFSKYLPKTSYFDQALFEGTPDAGTLVLEPKLSSIDPGIRIVAYGRGVTFCRLIDGATGKVLGSYTVSRDVRRPAWSTVSGAIEELISGMGADAAWYMVDAK